MKQRLKTLAIMIALAAITLVGCSGEYNDERGRGDAPVGPRNASPAEVVNFPDYFANVATKCNHGHRIYVTTREAGAWVVPNDRSCTEEGSQ